MLRKGVRKEKPRQNSSGVSRAAKSLVCTHTTQTHTHTHTPQLLTHSLSLTDSLTLTHSHTHSRREISLRSWSRRVAGGRERESPRERVFLVRETGPYSKVRRRRRSRRRRRRRREREQRERGVYRQSTRDWKSVGTAP
jgi:hypothetical protein